MALNADPGIALRRSYNLERKYHFPRAHPLALDEPSTECTAHCVLALEEIKITFWTSVQH